MEMHILHLANDFPYTQVYNQLVQAIDKRGVRQSVFTTLRHRELMGRNSVDFLTEGSKVDYSENWRPWFRVLFSQKIKSNYNHLLRDIDPMTITHTHAHTLFSDGVLALKLKQDFGIPYTVTIRNTDINTFMRYMVHTWDVGRRVMYNADRVVCISPAHIKRAMRWRFCSSDFGSKVINIPNGVNSYWLENLSCVVKPHHMGEVWHLLYIGNFSPNKNLPRLMEAIVRLVRNGYNLQLHIIGGKGRDTQRIESLARKFPETFHIYGVIREKERIRSIMHQCHLFTMPSLTETFGLVYVEALTQGLPLLYTRGEGVDGFFGPCYGVSCDPYKVGNIANAIKELISNYSSFSIDPVFITHNFSWDRIASHYIEIAGNRVPNCFIK